ncbi:hypothetical protein LR48_Vigan393s001500 [Vigna angularis]|uniref:Uncharacterized protein n=1 Tax=Phaseolus angularis TaxID=3914 RepID=A0A0L9T9N6_PHAAN|nr:hypothetical protein LR48_Vigan393s001500 [Vigna angularis]
MARPFVLYMARPFVLCPDRPFGFFNYETFVLILKRSSCSTANVRFHPLHETDRPPPCVSLTLAPFCSTVQSFSFIGRSLILSLLRSVPTIKRSSSAFRDRSSSPYATVRPEATA